MDTLFDVLYDDVWIDCFDVLHTEEWICSFQKYVFVNSDIKNGCIEFVEIWGTNIHVCLYDA
jgi:hypothetical protein